MKCMTINSSWLIEFGTFGAEFFTLLKKEEYEEIIKLSNGKIKKRIKNINLSNQDVINLERIIGAKFKKSFFNLQVFTDTRPNRIIGVATPKQEEVGREHLIKMAELSKDRANLNLKNNYVLLLYALRYSTGKIKAEQKGLIERLKRNRELLLKAELE